MQNLFLKILVLGGVIGGSCFVVWQAHDGLKTAAKQLDPTEFVALPEGQAATTDEPTKASAEWEHPLQLAEAAPEPVPTLAAAPRQSESERGSFDPLAHEGPPQQAERKLDESEFPLFFDKDQKRQPAAMAATEPAELPPAQSESAALEPAESEPVPTLSGRGDDLAMKSLPVEPSFVELPDQQVEAPEEPTPTLAASPPGQSEAGALVLPESPAARELERFGPAVGAQAVPDLPELPAAETANAPVVREMPGLTRLPPSHPGPVLLPIPSPAAEMEVPQGSSGVVTADAVESELEPVRKASDMVLPDAPRELIPPRAAPLMPADLPAELPAAMPVKQPAAEAASAEDPFANDPFALPSAPAAQPAPSGEPQPTLRSQPRALPEGAAAELPTVMPAGGVERAGGFEASPADAAEAFGIRQTGGEQRSGGGLPPLPPTGEVLPDIVPSAQPAPGLPEVKPKGMPAGEVLPLPPEPEAQPALPPASPIDRVSGSQPASLFPQEEPISRAQPAAVMSSAPGNRSEAFPELQQMPATATPNQLIGTAEFDANAPRGMQSPELKIEKIAPTEAEVGEPVIYAIIIRNVGGSEAKDVVVEDRIPRGAQLEGTIPQAYLNEGKLSWQLGSIEAGGERKIQLKVVPIEAGQIGSVATVSFAAAVSASIKVNAPKLTIAMNGPAEVVLGEPMQFQFILRNQGQGVAKSVFLRTILPPGLVHPGGSDLEYESGTLLPGAEKLIDLTLQADHEGVFTIHSQVTNDGKTHSETRADVSVIKSRLEITRTGPENRFVGRPANFMLKIANTSSEVLSAITIQEKLAADVELAAIPGGGRWDPKTRLITWKMDQLKPGEAREISLYYIAKSPGEHVGKIVAVDGAGNRSELNTQLTVKGFADLSPDYKADQRTVLVNERITLQMSLKNAGTASGRNIRAQFILPDGVEFVSARGPVEYQLNGNKIEFQTMEELPAGAEESFHLAVLAKQPGTSKITLMLQSDDYAEPVFQDQAIRVISNGE